MSNTRLELAQAMARSGLTVFICQPGSKRPLGGQSWYTRNTVDPAVVADWFDETPGCNFGVHPGNEYVVIDLDRKPDKNGVEAFDKLCAEHGITNWRMDLNTFTVATANGGYHLYFKSPYPVGNKNELPVGIDVRGAIGYVVGPGCEVTPEYSWSTGKYEVVDLEAEIAPLPEWLAEYLHEPGRRDPRAHEPVIEMDLPESIAQAREWLKYQDPAVENQNGDDHTYLTCCYMRDFGLTEETILALLTEGGDKSWNAKCDPSWDHGELRVKVYNSFEYAANRPGIKSVAHLKNRHQGVRPAGGYAFTDAQVKELHRPHLRLVEGNTALAVDPDVPDAVEEDEEGRPIYTWLDAAELFTDEFPPVEYLVDDYQMVPLRSVTCLDGDPDIGKSTLALNLALAVAADATLLDSPIKQMPVILIMYEDQMQRIQTMANEIADALGIEDRNSLPIIPLYVDTEEEAVNLAFVADDGTVEYTPFYDELNAKLKALGEPAFVVLDTVLEAVWHNQNFKAPTTAALKTVLRGLCRRHEATILTTRHPSARSVADGTFAPGDKANLGDLRQTIILEKDDDGGLILRHGKFNAGLKKEIRVARVGNVFHTTLHKAARTNKDDLTELQAAVLEEIKDARSRNLTVSPQSGGSDLNVKRITDNINSERAKNDKVPLKTVRKAFYDLAKIGHTHKVAGIPNGKNFRPTTYEVGPAPCDVNFWNEGTYEQFFNTLLAEADGPHRADHLALSIAQKCDAKEAEESGSPLMGRETEKERTREVLAWMKAANLSEYANKQRSDDGLLTFTKKDEDHG